MQDTTDSKAETSQNSDRIVDLGDVIKKRAEEALYSEKIGQTKEEAKADIESVFAPIQSDMTRIVAGYALHASLLRLRYDSYTRAGFDKDEALSILLKTLDGIQE